MEAIWYQRMKTFGEITHDPIRCDTNLERHHEKCNYSHYLLHEIRKRNANWIGHILRRNCLLQQVIEGKIKGRIEVTRRRGRRCKKLLDDLKDRRGYCQLKEGARDRTMWRNCFGRDFGPVVWQITDDDDDESLPFSWIKLFRCYNNYGN